MQIVGCQMETPLQSPHFFFHVGRNSADCTVNLINNGVNVLQGMVSIHFTGTGAASFYTCQVDHQPRRPCFSEFLVCAIYL